MGRRSRSCVFAAGRLANARRHRRRLDWFIAGLKPASTAWHAYRSEGTDTRSARYEVFLEGGSVEIAISKENLLKQADGLRELARRSRRLAETMTAEVDQRRLARVTEELRESATRLEQEAVAAKTG